MSEKVKATVLFERGLGGFLPPFEVTEEELVEGVRELLEEIQKRLKCIPDLKQKLKAQTEKAPELRQLHFASDGFSEIIAIYTLCQNKEEAVSVDIQVIAKDPDKQPEADELQKELKGRFLFLSGIESIKLIGLKICPRCDLLFRPPSDDPDYEGYCPKCIEETAENV